MKKKLLIALMSLGMVFNTCAFTSYADDGITVTLNGDKIEFDVQPQLIDNRTMVPLRKIFEAMGAVVDWDNDTQTVTATKDDKVVTAKINDRNLYINGVAKTLDVPPMIIDGRTLVPARFVAESFGANVDWVDSTQTVVISSEHQSSTVNSEFIDGFELADFEKCNSPASENGLGGAKIYLQAKLDDVDVIKTGSETDIIYGFFTDNNGYRWFGNLSATLYDDESNYTNLIGNPLVVCGIYQGYSEKYKVPAFDMYKLMNLNTGDTKIGFAKMTELLGIQENNTKTDTKTDTQKSEYDFSSTTGIESYLYENYKTLNTEIGKYSFSYHVTDYGYYSEDFCIDVEYDGPDLGLLFEYDTVLLNNCSDSEIENAKKQLKDFMKTLANDLINKMPHKKITGSYHDSHYRYPNLKMDLIIENYCTWSNYDRDNKSESVTASSFRWLNNLDGRKEY